MNGIISLPENDPVVVTHCYMAHMALRLSESAASRTKPDQRKLTPFFGPSFGEPFTLPDRQVCNVLRIVTYLSFERYRH